MKELRMNEVDEVTGGDKCICFSIKSFYGTCDLQQHVNIVRSQGKVGGYKTRYKSSWIFGKVDAIWPTSSHVECVKTCCKYFGSYAWAWGVTQFNSCEVS